MLRQDHLPRIGIVRRESRWSFNGSMRKTPKLGYFSLQTSFPFQSWKIMIFPIELDKKNGFFNLKLDFQHWSCFFQSTSSSTLRCTLETLVTITDSRLLESFGIEARFSWVSENSMTLRRRLAWHGHDAWFNPVIHFQYLTNWWIWWVFKPLCLVCWCYSIYILYYIIFILYHIILYYITTKSNKTNDVSYMLLR